MIEIPAPLVAPVQEPDVTAIQTNGDLLNSLIDHQAALRMCNGKLSSIGATYGKQTGSE
jgi:hypothetical protein